MSRPLLIVTSLLLLSACSDPKPGADDVGESGSESGGIVVSTGQDDVGTGSSTGAPEPTTTDAPTTGSTTGTIDDSCFDTDIVAKVRIPRVMLVLDKSGSMVAPGTGFWDADNDPVTPDVTRWSSLHAVVDFIVTTFEDRMDFGAVLFPSVKAQSKTDASACPVEAEPTVPTGMDQGAVILATIPPADATETIKGGTPAAAGITTAVGGLARNDMLPEEDDLRYIILVTDGAANCAADAVDFDSRFEQYDENLPKFVAEAQAMGISTFVVGIDIENAEGPKGPDGNPDVNTYEKLNEVAALGGVPREGEEKFYNTANQLELQAALQVIGTEILDCTLPLDPAPTKYQKLIGVDINPEQPGALEYGETQVADCATESGWRFTDETRSAIELCGDACALYKATGKVNVSFKCIDA